MVAIFMYLAPHKWQWWRLVFLVVYTAGAALKWDRWVKRPDDEWSSSLEAIFLFTSCIGIGQQLTLGQKSAHAMLAMYLTATQTMYAPIIQAIMTGMQIYLHLRMGTFYSAWALPLNMATFLAPREYDNEAASKVRLQLSNAVETLRKRHASRGINYSRQPQPNESEPDD